MYNAEYNADATVGVRSLAERQVTRSVCRGIGMTPLLIAAVFAVLAADRVNAEVVVEAREPQGAVAAAALLPSSRLTVKVNLPLDKAAALANRYQLTTNAKGRYAGIISYDGTLSVGKVKLSVSDEDQYPIRVEAPFTLKGTVGGSDLNEWGTATVDLAIRIETNWCPIVEFGKVSVALDDKPRPAAVGRSIPNFSDFVATQFLTGQLSSWAACDNIKAEINKVWHPMSFGMDSAGKNFLNVNPRSVSVSQFTVSGNVLKFVVTIVAATSIASSNANPAVTPLPDLVAVPASGPLTDVEATISLNVDTH
jgi:hypothetical protein